uniref:Integrase zinc-binding domain-containing protein n=1 Tax=Chrysotila carterae TaxID=13221 RepID=A0A7S4BF11_CHRCT
MADPAAAAAPASDPAPADPPDAEAAAAARSEHRLLFQRKLSEMLQGKSGMNTTLVMEVIRLVLTQWESRSGAEWKELYGTRPWKWRKKYRLVSVAGREVLAYASGGDAGSDAGLDSLSLVTTDERIFDDIYPIHVEGGHRKARTFYMAVHNRFGGGVPRWVCDLLCETCPLCVQKLTRKASSAGHKPIITKGFGSRGQIDLIDLQSCPERG